MEILKVDDKKDKKFLRRKTADFDFGSMEKKKVHKLVREMRETMHEADGMGLSANQVGIDASFFIAELDGNFYAVFNPEITKRSNAKFAMEEGCLSIPGELVEINHSDKLILRGFDRNGKRIKIKADGLLAAVFEHEVDHLNGKLITDHRK